MFNWLVGIIQCFFNLLNLKMDFCYIILQQLFRKKVTISNKFTVFAAFQKFNVFCHF